MFFFVGLYSPHLTNTWAHFWPICQIPRVKCSSSSYSASSASVDKQPLAEGYSFHPKQVKNCPPEVLCQLQEESFRQPVFKYMYRTGFTLPTQHTGILSFVLKSNKLPFSAWATFIFDGISHTYFSSSLKRKSHQHIRKLQVKKHKFWWSLRFKHPMLASKCR